MFFSIGKIFVKKYAAVLELCTILLFSEGWKKIELSFVCCWVHQCGFITVFDKCRIIYIDVYADSKSNTEVYEIKSMVETYNSISRTCVHQHSRNGNDYESPMNKMDAKRLQEKASLKCMLSKGPIGYNTMDSKG